MQKIFVKLTVGEKYCVVLKNFERQDIEKEAKYFRLFCVSADNLS